MAEPAVLDQLAHVLQVENVTFSHEDVKLNAVTHQPQETYQVYDVLVRNTSDAEVVSTRGSTSWTVPPKGTANDQVSVYGITRDRPVRFQRDYTLRLPIENGTWSLYGNQTIDVTIPAPES